MRLTTQVIRESLAEPYQPSLQTEILFGLGTTLMLFAFTLKGQRSRPFRTSEKRPVFNHS